VKARFELAQLRRPFGFGDRAGLALGEVEPGLEHGEHVLQRRAQAVDRGGEPAAQPLHGGGRGALVGRVQQQQQALDLRAVEPRVPARASGELAGQCSAQAECAAAREQVLLHEAREQRAARHVQLDDVLAGERRRREHHERHRFDVATAHAHAPVDRVALRRQLRREHERGRGARRRPRQPQHRALRLTRRRRQGHDRVAEHAAVLPGPA
jgi:hypothetical protein